MKKILILILVISLLFTFELSSSAASTASHIKLLTDDYGSVWKVDTREGMLLHENFTSSDYTFPSEIEGYKITGISENFSDGIYIALTSIVIPDGYKYIGDNAFKNCKYLESVVIPDSVEYIGDGAFENCESLKSVKLPKNLKYLGSRSFYGCKLIESISIPEGLETIGNSAFNYCSSLKNVTISESVKSIGAYAFGRTAIRKIFVPDVVEEFGHDVFVETPWIENFDSDFVVLNNVLVAYKGNSDIISIPKNVHVLCDYIFYESPASIITLPDTLEKIGDYAFANTTNIKNLRMPDSVTEIGTGLFSRSSVESVEFSPHITRVPDYTFSRSRIKGLCLTDNITEIGKYAYEYASLANLLGTNVRIPDHVEFIDDNAFSQAMATYATNVTLPDNITLGNSVFFGCYIPQVFGGENMVLKGANPFYSIPWWENMTKNVPMILGDGNLVYYKVSNPDGDVILPEGVKRITTDALSGLSAKRIICPSTLEEINPGAFSGKNAEEIVLNPGIKMIGENAFRSCKNLTKINWPDHISRIPNNCFEGCESLKDFDFTGVYELGEECFKETLVLTDSAIPTHIRTIEKNAFYGDYFENYYLEHIPEDAKEYCFGDYSPEHVYLNIEEGLIDYNPDWNLHSLVMHSKVEIVESGSNWMTLYFKYGIDSSFVSGINIDNRYDYDFGSPKYEVIDDHHIKVTGIYDYLFGTSMEFDEKMDNDWCLIQYDPLYVTRNEDGAYAFTYDRNGVITGYTGNTDYISVPESINGTAVTSVADGAFPNGDVTVYLPASVKEIGITNIGAGTKFEVSPENLYLSSYEGCLYDGFGGTLISCALNEEQWSGKWHENITEIGDRAFYNSTVSEISFPDGVIKVGADVFGDSGNIKYIQLPDSIQNIGSDLVSGGNAVVYFVGSVRKIDEGAFGSNVRAYASENYEVNGNTIRKRLTSSGMFSLFTPEVDNENNKVYIPLFINRGEIRDIQVITMIKYTDGTADMCIEDISSDASDFFEYDVSKEVKEVKSFIWNLETLIPLSYSEAVAE